MKYLMCLLGVLAALTLSSQQDDHAETSRVNNFLADLENLVKIEEASLQNDEEQLKQHLQVEDSAEHVQKQDFTDYENLVEREAASLQNIEKQLIDQNEEHVEAQEEGVAEKEAASLQNIEKQLMNKNEEHLKAQEEGEEDEEGSEALEQDKYDQDDEMTADLMDNGIQAWSQKGRGMRRRRWRRTNYYWLYRRYRAAYRREHKTRKRYQRAYRKQQQTSNSYQRAYRREQQRSKGYQHNYQRQQQRSKSYQSAYQKQHRLTNMYKHLSNTYKHNYYQCTHKRYNG